uniref:Hypotheticial protein n=1 Tax=Schistosoma japonicum TaxID=6182 RepID=C1LK16_SCHJA|nr:hypotheticial protein [Schistosoma japonicum]
MVKRRCVLQEFLSSKPDVNRLEKYCKRLEKFRLQEVS